jgi:hypothetical protein
MAAAPQQSFALAAQLATPPTIPVGTSNGQSIMVAEDYCRNVKRLKADSDSNITIADVDASQVGVILLF